MKTNTTAPMVAGIVLLLFSCTTPSQDTSERAQKASSVMKMQYDITGQGTPLVLVPGGLTGWKSWEPHAQVLSQERKVIRVQLLNVQFGLENRQLPDLYSVTTESAALAATLDSLGLGQPLDIAAWSFGAFTSLQYALDHPERVRSLTLIEPPAMWVLRQNGRFDEATQKEAEFFQTLHGDISEDMLAEFLKHAGFVGTGESAKDHPQWNNLIPFRQSLRNSPGVVEYTDDLQRLRSLEVPTLLVKGTGSSRWLHQVVDTLSANLPRSRVIEFAGGHAPHIVSMKDFMEAFQQFLKNPEQ